MLRDPLRRQERVTGLGGGGLPGGGLGCGVGTLLCAGWLWRAPLRRTAAVTWARGTEQPHGHAAAATCADPSGAVGGNRRARGDREIFFDPYTKAFLTFKPAAVPVWGKGRPGEAHFLMSHFLW